ncbi:threonine aldolase family protein [Benzoatithermus flavus]|uniref:GntG family PLP-dependent aldolase n=1 Tax=Benzoatithermus flavus TaxID=3108223 RepID=A0ABU8XTS5_9PROT
MIDLRSDTLTRPTPAMRAAIAAAEVGDDVYGEDPTVAALERRTAELLGKEAALFVPSGTMANQVALRCHTEPGDEILAEAAAHIVHVERGAPAALSGLTIRTIPSAAGVFDADDLRPFVRVPSRYMPAGIFPPTKLVCLENTHNFGGGTVWSVETMAAVARLAHEHGIKVHLDGARLWNAAVASGRREAEFAAHADSVSVCFSKGLGAPVGSALAGSAVFIERARRFRGMFGGGMRQAGILAAAALHALDHHRDRLAVDHARARAFAAGLAALSGIGIDPGTVQTNIVIFRVTAMPAAAFVERCWKQGLRMLPAGADKVRAVFHLDLPENAVEEALRIAAAALAAP